MGLRDRNLLKDEQCFFVTTTCHRWKRLLHSDAAFQLVADSLNFCMDKYDVDTLGYVIMPNHLHVIQFYKKKNHLSEFMRDFKKFTSVKLRHEIEQSGNSAMVDSLRHEVREQKFKVWNDRFDDRVLVTRTAAAAALDYMHNNPLQEHWRLATKPEDYPYSSAGFYESGAGNIVRLTHLMQYF